MSSSVTVEPDRPCPVTGWPRVAGVAILTAAIMAGLTLGVAVALWRSSQDWDEFGRDLIGRALWPWGFLALAGAVAIGWSLARPAPATGWARKRRWARLLGGIRRRSWLLHLAIWLPLLTLAVFGASIEFWRLMLVALGLLLVLFYAALLRLMSAQTGLPGSAQAFVVAACGFAYGYFRLG